MSSPQCTGYAVDLQSGTVYGSKKELAEGGLHHANNAEAYCKDRPELHVFSVLSGNLRSTVCECLGSATTSTAAHCSLRSFSVCV